MTVQLKRLCEQRCVVLHFHPRPFARNVKEAGMLYLGAATGTFHGMYIAPERRGQGVMKHFFAYYVAFCRHCGLAHTPGLTQTPTRTLRRLLLRRLLQALRLTLTLTPAQALRPRRDRHPAQQEAQLRKAL